MSRVYRPTKTTLGYKNHKSCKILPKFSSTLHFSQESYKFVQESQTLQFCYNVEHFLQDSDNIFAKNAFFWSEILTRNVMCHFDQKFKTHQTTSNNSHSCRLQCTNCPRIPSKGFKLLILSRRLYMQFYPKKLL